MRFTGSRLASAASALIVGAATVVLAIGGGGQSIAGAATTPSGSGLSAGPFQVVVQTMDSCKDALNGAAYELVNSAGAVVSTAGSQGPSQPGAVSGGAGCPLEQGDCASTSKGCLVFGAIPAGDYRLIETETPAGNSTNPDGYAACNTGSGCRWEAADVTVNGDGTVLAQVTNVAPNGQVQTFPSDPTRGQYYAGTLADPIVIHNFGLCQPGNCPTTTTVTNPPVPPSTTPTTTTTSVPNACDSDADQDDWITGAHSGQCDYTGGAAGPVCTSATPGMFVQDIAADPKWLSATGGFPWLCETAAMTRPLVHLQEVILSAPQTVTPWEPFTVGVSGGSVPSLSSPQDATMVATPNGAGGFTVGVDPIRAGASKKNPNPGFTTGTITITGPGVGRPITVNVGTPAADTNANFVGNLYHDVLGRPGDTAGVVYWTGQLDNGVNRGIVAKSFIESTEAHQHIVNNDYMLVLGRGAEPGGLAYWTSQLNAGAYNETLLGLIAGGTEFYNSPSRGQGTNTGFVTALYKVFFNRPADQGGVSYWVGRIQAGLPYSQVADAFAFSHEFHMDVAAGWYTQYLHRAPDPSGQAYWADNLDAGQTDDVGAVNFLTSDEYYNEAPRY